MGFVTPEGKQYLRSGYAFRCNNYSLSENLFLSNFWDKFTRAVFPVWLAPNTITVAGGLIMVACFSMLAFYHPEAPQWSHFLVAFFVFAYQTLDGCDGKQARRTQSSSPLGELFDHGIDALAMTMFTYTVASAARHFDYPFLSCFFGIMWLTFFAAHWEHYHTDVFVLGTISASDAQLGIIAMQLYSGVFGYDMYHGSFNLDLSKYGLAGLLKGSDTVLTLKGADVIALLCLLTALGLVLRSVLVVFAHIRTSNVKKSHVGILLQYWPLLSLATLFVIADKMTPALSEHPILFIILGGISFGFVLSTLNVSRVTNQPYSNFYVLHLMCLAPLILMATVAAFGTQNKGASLDYYAVLKYGLVFVGFLYSFFVIRAVHEIANIMDISPFKIRKLAAKKQ